MTYKAKVFISSRHIGWLRNIETRGGANEYVVVASDVRATKFEAETVGIAMSKFEGPDRPSSKAAIPAVTFQLVKV
jgi:hypothetical protein